MTSMSQSLLDTGILSAIKPDCLANPHSFSATETETLLNECGSRGTGFTPPAPLEFYFAGVFSGVTPSACIFLRYFSGSLLKVSIQAEQQK